MTAHPSLLEMFTDLNIAEAIVGLLFSGTLAWSVFLWVSHLNKKEPRPEHPAGIPAWSIGWANFGLFICTLVMSVLFTQIFVVKLASYLNEPVTTETTAEEPSAAEPGSIEEAVNADHSDSSELSESPEPPALTPWFAVLSVLTLQIPMILSFYGLRKFYPADFGGPLNRNPVSIRQAISKTTPYFVRYLPVIWLISGAWVGLLTGLQKLDILDELPPQELVTLFGKGENSLAIVLLAVFAVALAPFVEEIIFRGAIYRFLKGHTNIFTAQLISGAFFAMVHSNLMSFLPLLTIGVLLAQLYEKEGNILPSMIYHAYWNGFSLLLLFLLP